MNNKKQLLIDLTPLLDIILILLFLVLVNSQEQNKQLMEQQEQKFQTEKTALEQAVSENQQKIDDLQNTNDLLQEKNQEVQSILRLSDAEQKAFSTILEKALLMQIEIPENYPDAKLELTVNRGETIVKPENQTVQQWLQDKIKENKAGLTVIILKYAGDKILWQDYQQIKQSIEKIKNESAEVFFSEENTARSIKEERR